MNVLAFLPMVAIPVLLIAAELRARKLGKTRPNATENLALLVMVLGAMSVAGAQ